MNEPWFAPQYAWIFGAAVGILGGIVGTAVGLLAPRGKAKGTVFGLNWFAVLISAGSLLGGIIALVSGQPYHVWYGLGLAGLIGVLVFGLNYFTLTMAYRQAELRKLNAQHLG
jgi:MFS family permease